MFIGFYISYVPFYFTSCTLSFLFYVVLNMQRTSEYENDVFSKDVSFFMFCKSMCTDMPQLSDCFGKVTGSYKKRAVRYFL